MSLDNAVLTTDNCRYCLMCRHVCPVGHVTRLETLTPHGWGLLISSVQRGLATWTDSAVDKLYSCADCGTCQSHCVTDQPLPAAIAEARADVAAAGLAPAHVVALNQTIERWGNPYREQEPEAVSGTGDVALFVGDEALYLWPDGLQAALSLLRAAGIDPVLIGAGRNSGYIPSSLGFPETARRLAAANLADLQASQATMLLTLNPGDAYVFGTLYSERLGIDFPANVELKEVTALLAERLAAGDLKLRRGAGGPPYAYIDPAHTSRMAGRDAAPRQLLAAVMPAPGRELFWRRERTHPAGSTSLRFANPMIAEHLTYARLGDARAAGAQVLICEDAGTLNVLASLAPRFGLTIQGLYELLAEQLEGTQGN
ncbi:MAG: (Fe-S)-binding protein [Caldilineae bacterium]|nr:(Fe-S)-binding protein [Caldilineae bacterium]